MIAMKTLKRHILLSRTPTPDTNGFSAFILQIPGQKTLHSMRTPKMLSNILQYQGF